METRKAVQIPFLEEPPLEEIKEAKLPNNLALFRHFWYHFKVLGKKAKVAYRDSAKAAIASWVGIGLKPKKIDCVIEDIKDLHEDHKVMIFLFYTFQFSQRKKG